MEHTSRNTGRLGLLATPLVTTALALALSACGSLAPSNASAPSGASPSTASATANASAPGSSAPSGASATAFCGIWQETRTALSEMNAIMGNGYSMSTSASVLLPTMQAINGVFGRLDQVAPAAVSADMGTLASFWNEVVAAFQHGSTVGQVKAYLHAHPPAQTATIGPAVHHRLHYLSTTCHINVSS